MLSAKVVPPAGADTEYADLRTAYDALPAETQGPDRRSPRPPLHRVFATGAGLRVLAGGGGGAQGRDPSAGAALPRTNRKSLYVASHASRIIDWPIPEGRLLLRDLIEHATQRQFVYRHSWRVGDLVIWDNRCTMHRATPFEDTKYRRELRRVTTLDIAEPSLVTSPA